jgi:hypothetical protein
VRRRKRVKKKQEKKRTLWIVVIIRTDSLVAIQFPDVCKEVVGWWHLFSINQFGLGARLYHFARNGAVAFSEKKMLIEMKDDGPPCSHGDKGDNGLELALLGLVMPLPEYQHLRKSNNLGLIPFSSYMEMAERVKELTGSVRTIYLQTDDPEVWGNMTEYPEWRFLRWQPEGSFQVLAHLLQWHYWARQTTG